MGASRHRFEIVVDVEDAEEYDRVLNALNSIGAEIENEEQENL